MHIKLRYLIALSIVPLALNAIAVLYLLPDIVPLHLGFNGIDRYGSKYETFVLGGLFTATNLLLAFFHVKAERLGSASLIHGTDAKGARRILFWLIIVMNALFFLMLIFWLFTAGRQ